MAELVMPRVPMRMHLNVDGTPKRRMSKDRAERHAAYLARLKGCEVRAYPCPICGGSTYHVGRTG